MLAPPLDRLAALRERPRRLLAVFPHPDDEAYGCAGLLHRLGADPGGAVVLVTLTRGEASSVLAARGLSPDEVGDLRAARLACVRETTALDELVLGTFPDGRLARLPVPALADPLAALLDAYRPQVVVGHCPRGVNGHADHIATHWALRHALRGRAGVRFAMITYPPEVAESAKPRLLFPTKPQELDAAIELTETEIDAKEACLRAHDAIVTLRPGGDGELWSRPATEFFDLFGENHDPWLTDLFDDLPEGAPA